MKEIEMTDDRILYFGTLALRGKESALTLKKLLKLSGWKEILFDVNFRQNFYSAETVRLGLQHCTILKFSREEADILIKLGLAFSKFSLLTLCKELSRRYPNIHTILLTLDKEGATVYQADTGKFTPSPALKCEVVSLVGAGDSFFAGYLHSMLRGRDTVSCLNNAITLSSYVVGHLEAVPKYTKELLAQLK